MSVPAPDSGNSPQPPAGEFDSLDCTIVVDDGPGVPEEELQRLVERRQRGDEARQRHPYGLGLGLHIARDVVERHGFRMTLGRSEHGGLEAAVVGGHARVYGGAQRPAEERSQPGLAAGRSPPGRSGGRWLDLGLLHPL